MLVTKSNTILKLSIFILVFSSICPLSLGQDEQTDTPNLIHWAYSSLFGTGVYRVSNNQNAYIIRFRPRWTQVQDRGSDWKRPILLEFRFPITIGIYNFDWNDILEGIFPDRFSQISIAPGIEVEIPLSRRWAIRPLAHIGYGTEMDGGDAAWIYWLALKSRFDFAISDLDLYLLNSFGWYGFTPDSGNAQNLAAISTGIEGHYPIKFLKLGEDTWYVKAHIMNIWYLNEIDFIGPESTFPKHIKAEWEFALGFGKQERIKIWIFRFDHMGLAYRFSEVITGIRFYFNAWFSSS